MNYITHYRSPFGGITLACDGEALTGLWFDGQKYFGRTLEKDYVERKLPILEETVSWLNQYFNGRDPGFSPKLNPHGTPFQNRSGMFCFPFLTGKSSLTGRLRKVSLLR